MRTLRVLRAAIANALLAGATFKAEALESRLFDLLPRRDGKYRRPLIRTTGRRYAPNGKRECARHVAQIAAGRLKAANGLVTVRGASHA